MMNCVLYYCTAIKKTGFLPLKEKNSSSSFAQLN